VKVNAEGLGGQSAAGEKKEAGEPERSGPPTSFTQKEVNRLSRPARSGVEVDRKEHR
jgi:hypothetical protein